jgi:hypothetical protein
MLSLQDMSYKVLSRKTSVLEVVVGKKYKMLLLDGVNYISLGKCIEKKFEERNYINDFTPSISFTFEKNNDNPFLKRFFVGEKQVSYGKINIEEDLLHT